MQADVNVSLTSISLLWNASDLLGKLYSKARSRSSSRSSMELEPATNGNTGSHGAQLDSDQYQELIRLLYGALQVSSCHYAGQDSVSVTIILYCAVWCDPGRFHN